MSLETIPDMVMALGGSYGVAALALVVFLAALGAPLPATLCVIAAGAAAARGLLSPAAALGVGFVGVVAGDLSSYGLGRLLRGPIRRRYGRRPAWRQAEQALERRGGAAVLLTRFVLTPLAFPVNLIAGGAAYPPARFLAYAAAGEALWLLGYGGLGFVFSSQWDRIGDIAGTGSGLLAAVALAGLAAYALLQRRGRPYSGATHQKSTSF